MTMERIILIYLLVMNLMAFIAYGWDKRKARKGQWRTPESALLWMAVLGGCYGASLGMRIFRHKTKHKKFTIIVPACILAWTVLLVALYMKVLHA